MYNENTILRIESVRQEKISDWELGFTESILARAKKGQRLTEKQLKVLVRIESKHSAEAKKEKEEWAKEYLSSFRQRALLCAEYYSSQGEYFTDLADKILNDPDFVPSRKQFKVMCLNKYCDKVLEETNKPPKYKVGDMVTIAHTMNQRCSKNIPAVFRGQPTFIVEVNAGPVVSAAKGAKRYRVLPMGHHKTLVVEERWLKKVKKSS